MQWMGRGVAQVGAASARVPWVSRSAGRSAGDAGLPLAAVPSLVARARTSGGSSGDRGDTLRVSGDFPADPGSSRRHGLVLAEGWMVMATAPSA